MQFSHNLKFTNPKLVGSGLTAKPSDPVADVGTCSLSIMRNAGFEPEDSEAESEEREDPEDRVAVTAIGKERKYLFCSWDAGTA